MYIFQLKPLYIQGARLLIGLLLSRKLLMKPVFLYLYVPLHLQLFGAFAYISPDSKTLLNLVVYSLECVNQ